MAALTEIDKDLKIAATKPKGRVAHLAGFPAEHRLHADIRSFLPIQQMGLRSIAILKSVREPEDPSFYDTIADSVEDRLITREQELGIFDADLITRARIKETGEVVYHAIQVSIVIDQHDVQKAIDNAKAISSATKTAAFPIAIGNAITPEAVQATRKYEVTAFTTPLLEPTWAHWYNPVKK